MKLNSTALTRATIGVIWLIVAMTLESEVSPPFKSFLTGLAGHHWAGKSVIAAAAFVVFYLLLQKLGESKGILGGTLVVVASVVLGGLTIFLFFVKTFLNL